MNVNRVFIGGRITRDPELHEIAPGSYVVNITVAVNRKWTTQAGEKKEAVDYIDCDAFGTVAETINKYMSKGRGIYLEGRLRLESWEDKFTKKTRTKMKVVIESFQFTEKRPIATPDDGWDR
jgi:single-strand DNA-binding protein